MNPVPWITIGRPGVVSPIRPSPVLSSGSAEAGSTAGTTGTSGTTAAEAMDAAESPRAEWATTVTVVAVEPASTHPVTTVSQLTPPGAVVAVYPVAPLTADQLT